MPSFFDLPSIWLTSAIWTGIALLAAFVIWTVVRAPGKRHDPGRPENRPPPPSSGPDEPSGRGPTATPTG